MKVYNRSLDYITLAMAKGRQGDVVQAAKLFAKAIQEPDAVRAVAILEASNRQAFTAAKVQAKAQVKAAVAVAASKRLKANEEFDLGDQDDVEGLAGDEDTVIESAADEDEDDGEDGDDFDAQFASVLAGMSKAKVRK